MVNVSLCLFVLIFVCRLTPCDSIKARAEVFGGCFWCDRMKIEIFFFFFWFCKEQKEEEENQMLTKSIIVQSSTIQLKNNPCLWAVSCEQQKIRLHVTCKTTTRKKDKKPKFKWIMGICLDTGNNLLCYANALSKMNHIQWEAKMGIDDDE